MEPGPRHGAGPGGGCLRGRSVVSRVFRRGGAGQRPQGTPNAGFMDPMTEIVLLQKFTGTWMGA
ncbi:hypothetical protein GCM10009548_48870 [Streptomyces malaysiensis subsp. malaysiensis]